MAAVEQGFVSNGLCDIFANPQHHATTLGNRLLWFADRDMVVRRHADHIALSLESSSGDDMSPSSLLIPMTERALNHWRGLFADRGSLLNGALRLSENQRIRSIRHREYAISTDMMIYAPPSGEPITEYLSRDPHSAQHIHDAIERLESELRLCDCYFMMDNFAADQLIISDDGELYLQQLFGLDLDSGSSPRQCCDALRRWLYEYSEMDPQPTMPSRKRSIRVEGAAATVEGHIWCGVPHEERIAVLDPSGYGFVDMDNRVVVASRYRSITSFKEGRAVVESDRGYGLINVWGEFILDDIYEDMSYDEYNGITKAKLHGKWLCYNYIGEELTPNP